MKSKITFTALSVAIVTLILGMIAAPAFSQVSVPVGKTTLQSSQLVLWYDSDFNIDNDRESFLQVTNASIDTPVWVHVQIFASSCTSFDLDRCIGTVTLCAETDFNDFYTPNDTHLYIMNNVHRNDPLNQGPEVGNFIDTKGFVVVTPIDGPGMRNAIAHQHMMGNTWVTDDEDSQGYGLSAMGRDAVSFSSGNVVADGTVLDGVANGYVLIQPSILKYNFNNFQWDDSDIVSIAFSDNYEGVFGYVAEPADATWTPLIFDDEENPISCGTIPQNCFLNVGTNTALEPHNDLLNPVSNLVLCSTNDFGTGWMKIAIGGLSGLENELGIATFTDAGPEYGVANWMYAE